MSWVTDLWQILETVATLTKEVERANGDIKELRRDVHSLTLAVADLKNELRNEKETTRLVLDNYENEVDHSKESIAAKFDVLTTRLDSNVMEFEHRLNDLSPRSSRRKQLTDRS